MSVEHAKPSSPLLRPEDLNDPQACIERADALRRERDFAGSLEFSQLALALNPNDIHALHLSGWNLVDLGRVAEAREIADRAITVAPGHPQLHWLRGFVLLLLGEFEQGWAEYEARWHIEGMGLAHQKF